MYESMKMDMVHNTRFIPHFLRAADSPAFLHNSLGPAQNGRTIAADMVYCLSAFDSHFGLSKASYTRNVGESAIGQK